MRKIAILLFATVLLVQAALAQTGTTYFVKTTGSDAADGKSWGAAFATLQKALVEARSGSQIWVAAGTYYPTSDASGNMAPADSRTKTFVMVEGVAIYGGFAGGESSLDARDWKGNFTILSGDIDRNSTLDNGNSYHVVSNFYNGLSNNARLDGFTLTAGNANVGGNGNEYGGGMLNFVSSPTVANCTFSTNEAYLGGAMLNYNNSTTVVNCTFSGNKAAYGGGLFNQSASITLTNCLFSGNQAVTAGGGIYNIENSSPIFLTNCTVSGNQAPSGGGIHNSSSSSTLTNCIVWGNNSGIGGAATVTYSIVQGGWSGTGNSNRDPLFVAMPDYTKAPTTAGNLQLPACSPALNAGDNSANTTSTDVAGNPRIYNSGIIDLGAYEYQGSPAVPPGDPTVFGQNAWNVYAWNSGGANSNSDTWNKYYRGFYTNSRLNFKSNEDWSQLLSPSSAPNYQGCPVEVDNFSFSAKRKGFPCGYYQLGVPSVDDEAQLWVNGKMVWTGRCCGFIIPPNIVWTGWLGADDEIEFRISEGGGGAVGHLNFTPITLTGPGNLVKNSDADRCSAVVTYAVSSNGNPAPALSYKFEGATSTEGAFLSGTGSGSAFNKGETKVTVSTTNGCGDLSVSFTVTVADNQAPVITAPQDVMVSCDASTAPAQTGSATATDNCGTVTVMHSDVSTKGTDANTKAFYNYTITRTWTAKDGAGKEVSKDQVITVQDITRPVVRTKSATIYLDASGKATLTTAEVNNGSSDNCSPLTLRLSKTSFDCSNQGESTVTLFATDVSGNEDNAQVTVTVADNQSPVLNPAANQQVNLTNNCTIVIPDVRGTATDNCSVTITQSPAAGSFVSAGHNQMINVTVTAEDAAGKKDVKTVVLTAKDVTPPAMTCPASVVINPTSLSGAPFSWTAPVGSDNCAGAQAVRTDGGPANGAQFPIGTTTVSYKVVDAAGLSTTCSFTVTVRNPYSTDKKVFVCHYGNNKTLDVSVNALETHLAHGDKLGRCEWYGSSLLVSTAVQVAPKTASEMPLPVSFTLSASPNPVRHTARIQYTVPVQARVSLRVFDVLGREVGQVFSGERAAGTYMQDYGTQKLSGGVYYLQLSATTADGKSFTQTQKLVKAE